MLFPVCINFSPIIDTALTKEKKLPYLLQSTFGIIKQTNRRALYMRYSRKPGKSASLELLKNWRSKFPGLEKKSRKRGISSPTSTNSVCNSSAVNSRWFFRSFSAKTSKSLAIRWRSFASTSSSESAIGASLEARLRNIFLSLQGVTVTWYFQKYAQRDVNKLNLFRRANDLMCV